MKHIAVISEMELGSHRAHAINVVKTAGGFARLGYKVTLLCRGPAGGAGPSACALHLAGYGEQGLAVELEAGPAREDEESSRATGVWAARRAAALGADLVYARHYAGALESLGLGLRTIMETHAYVGATKPMLDDCFRATRLAWNPLTITTISARLRDDYISRGGDPGRVHIVPDGVDLGLFARPAVLPRSPLSGDGPHVLYSGHLYDYKGIPTILEAAALRPRLRFHLLGGTHEDETRVRAAVAFARLGNVTVHGHVPHASVARYLWHANVLLLPPSGNDPSAAWTSPVKLGEYLASQTPVVASAIPGLRDWVSAPAVRWFEPDSAEGLATAIDGALGESAAERVERRAEAAALAESFSYPNRAAAILRAATPADVSAAA